MAKRRQIRFSQKEGRSILVKNRYIKARIRCLANFDECKYASNSEHWVFLNCFTPKYLSPSVDKHLFVGQYTVKGFLYGSHPGVRGLLRIQHLRLVSRFQTKSGTADGAAASWMRSVPRTQGCFRGAFYGVLPGKLEFVDRMIFLLIK